jgi:hypothetical protein
MMVAFAGVVHNRQGAADSEHQCRQDEQYRGISLAASLLLGPGVES